MIREQEKPLSTNVDWLTLVLYFIFVISGWVNIYSAVYEPTHSSIFDISQSYGKQLLWIGLSLLVGFVIVLTDEKFFFAFAYIIYGITIILLVGTLFFSKEVKGAHAWFEIGGFKLQPAEFAKFAASLALAKYLSGYDVKFKDNNVKLISIGIIILPMVIILMQNDTGSALVFLSFSLALYREGLSGFILFIGFAVAVLSLLALVFDTQTLLIGLGILSVLIFLFIRRSKQAILLLLVSIVVACIVIFSVDYVFNNVLQPHQKQRINVLLGQEIDLKGAGYNVHQSKIAIGSGGLFGKGFLEGTQTKYNFVPEQSTDFIFCTIGEEYGWMGSLFLTILYMGFLMRILYLSERQRSKFNRIYGYCVAAILFFHYFINIGMTIGLLPVIGIPLPFFSYGGSSLLSFTILLFILLRLDANRVFELGDR